MGNTISDPRHSNPEPVSFPTPKPPTPIEPGPKNTENYSNKF